MFTFWVLMEPNGMRTSSTYHSLVKISWSRIDLYSEYEQSSESDDGAGSQSSDDEQRQYASLKSVPFFVGEFHRARKPAPLNRFSSTVSRAMMSSANAKSQSSDDKYRTPSLKSVPFFVEEFPMRKPAPLVCSSTVSRAMLSSARTLSLLCRSSSKSSICAETRRCTVFVRGQSSDD
ncbi:hypothetical protein EVAR_46026_1 [Eumeta japonica]|uniref:Uncharacterized protein n=1 Tax=Eumeta variegata TaxID=151549 RepID=A0A4C1Z6N7_EUMVA|nr:hypothetical protein EVAR_46026_1 [Eumeta japonica]